MVAPITPIDEKPTAPAIRFLMHLNENLIVAKNRRAFRRKNRRIQKRLRGNRNNFRPFQGYQFLKAGSRLFNAGLFMKCRNDESAEPPVPVEIYEIHPLTWEVAKLTRPAWTAWFEEFDFIAAMEEIGVDWHGMAR